MTAISLVIEGTAPKPVSKVKDDCGSGGDLIPMPQGIWHQDGYGPARKPTIPIVPLGAPVLEASGLDGEANQS